MNKHKKQISSFLNKNIKKIALPFINLFKSTNVSESNTNKIKILPKNKKPKQETKFLYEIAEPNSEVLTNSLVFGNFSTVPLPKKEKSIELIREIPQQKILFTKIPNNLDKNVKTLSKFDIKNANSISNIIFFGKTQPIVENNQRNNKETQKNTGLIDSKLRNNKETQKNTGLIGSKLYFTKNIESKQKINAKLEPNAASAGGKEGPKVVVLKNLNKIGPKEAALVGEDGPEKIIQSKGFVLPVKQINTATKQVNTTKIQNHTNKNINTSPINFALNTQKNESITRVPITVSNLVSSNTGKLSFLKENLPKEIAITFEKPKNLTVKTTKSTQTSKSEKTPAKNTTISAPIGLIDSEIQMSQSEKEDILQLAENKKISNTIQKLPDGRTVIKLPGYAEGRGGDIMSSTSSGGENISSVFGNLAGGLGKMATTAFKASPLGMVASAASSAVSSLLGNEDKKEETAKVMTTQGNNFNPMNVTNISYQYDIYRKTADDAFMLPNFRREYG